jgi:hypothetical protein
MNLKCFLEQMDYRETFLLTLLHYKHTPGLLIHSTAIYFHKKNIGSELEEKRMLEDD